MPIISKTYKPHWLLRNGHVHTIYPALFRKPQAVLWQRQRLELPDGDFLNLDWHRQNSQKLVVLGHGLEGSSSSTYIQAAAHMFYQNGFDVLAWNHRSCGGEMNRLPRFYHHGVSDDLHMVMQQTSNYAAVHYVGYSLGGNVLLKYFGEEKFAKPQNLLRAVAISAPIDLHSCVQEIHRVHNRLYHNRFLKSLLAKVVEKHQLMPNDISIAHLTKIKTLTDFDHYYTAPLHGFDSPKDYYTRASSRQFLPNITLPVLLLQAQDDPMLGHTCYPITEAQASENLHLIITKHGGHVAFMQKGKRIHWMEEVALEFVGGLGKL